jgi:hypothetical protein
MGYRMRLGKTLVGAAFILAAATGADALALDAVAGHPAFAGGHVIANELVDGWKNDGPANPTIEPDPTDDGNIVVECVAFTESSPPGGGVDVGAMNLSALIQASMPQRGLGPSKCPPFEFRRLQ